jgi:hypothetical protein
VGVVSQTTGVATGATQRELVPQPHGGALVAPYKPGESGNPSGVPAGYVPLSKAAQIVAMLGPEDVKLIAGGEFPPNWDKLKSMQYVRAARTLQKELDGERLTDRMDGPVPTKAEVSGPDGRPLFSAGDVE